MLGDVGVSPHLRKLNKKGVFKSMINVTNSEYLSPYFTNAQNNNEDDCCVESCATCDLVNEYIELISNVESKLELEEYLFGLVEEAQKHGLQKALIADIHMKSDLLESLENDCDCDECCELD